MICKFQDLYYTFHNYKNYEIFYLRLLNSVLCDRLKKHLSLHILGWTSEPQPQTRNRTFNCRFLVKPPDDKDETMEEKQQRISKYESMQISSALLPSNADRLESGDVSSESSDIVPCVMCVARRIPPNEKLIGPVEQFTVRLDTTGKIIAVDISWLSPAYSKYLNKVKMHRAMPHIMIIILFTYFDT